MIVRLETIMGVQLGFEIFDEYETFMIDLFILRLVFDYSKPEEDEE